MTVIYIKDLVVQAKHGVNQAEKEHPQRFVFNLELTFDGAADVSDDLADGPDYRDLRQTVIDVAQNNSFNLIEKLARTIADRILEDKRVKKIVVSIDKPDVWDDGVPGVRLEATAD